MKRSLLVFFASGAYLGFAPVASGTFGSLAGVALYPVFDALRRGPTALYLLTFFGLVAASIWIAGEAEVVFGEKDSGKIAIDEVAGYITATLFLPPTLTTILGSFFLFRLFDVLKPWPARYFDRQVGGGPGVVLDDVFAGFYANLLLRAVFWAAGLTV